MLSAHNESSALRMTMNSSQYLNTETSTRNCDNPKATSRSSTCSEDISVLSQSCSIYSNLMPSIHDHILLQHVLLSVS